MAWAYDFKTSSLQMKGRWESKCLVPIYVFPEMKLYRVQPRYFHNRIIMFCLPIPTSIYLWDIYIDIHDRSVYFAAAKYVDRSWEYIYRSQTHECRNWEYGRAVPFPGIHRFNFWYSAVPEKWFGMGRGFFGAISLQKLTGNWNIL